MHPISILSILLSTILTIQGPGLLILYRPYDVSSECAFSHHLRYDLSFGMGMSDTITLVFRTLNSVDYECMVEIVTNSRDVYLIIVIMFPNTLGYNCFHNPDAFAVLKQDECFRLCDTILSRDEYSPYFVASMQERFRFRFASNSNINADMSAHMYQVTATAARLKPPNEKDCHERNETVCVNGDSEYCFSSGFVCDGIKNCGVEDWFDERKLDCGLPVERLGFAPVFAITTAILCAALAACHLLMRCLPPLANSYFVFNTNEDNRLCMDTVFKSPGEGPREIGNVARASLVPVSSSSSSMDSSENQLSERASVLENDDITKKERTFYEDKQGQQQSLCKTTTIRSMTGKIQMKFKAMTKLGRPKPSAGNGNFLPSSSFDV